MLTYSKTKRQRTTSMCRVSHLFQIRFYHILDARKEKYFVSPSTCEWNSVYSPNGKRKKAHIE